MNGRVGQSRHDRKWSILRSMALRLREANDTEWVTLGEIAKDQKLKPTNHLRQILAELAAGNHILVRRGEAPNHEVRFEYALNMEAPVNSDFASNWKEYQEEFWC